MESEYGLSAPYWCLPNPDVLWFSDSMASAPHRLAHPGGAEAETALFLPSEPVAAALQGTAGGSAQAKHLTGSNGSMAAGQLPRGSAHSLTHMAEPAIPIPAQPGAPG